jgi:hypothetical protein
MQVRRTRTYESARRREGSRAADPRRSVVCKLILAWPVVRWARRASVIGTVVIVAGFAISHPRFDQRVVVDRIHHE